MLALAGRRLQPLRHPHRAVTTKGHDMIDDEYDELLDDPEEVVDLHGLSAETVKTLDWLMSFIGRNVIAGKEKVAAVPRLRCIAESTNPPTPATIAAFALRAKKTEKVAAPAPQVLRGSARRQGVPRHRRSTDLTIWRWARTRRQTAEAGERSQLRSRTPSTSHTARRRADRHHGDLPRRHRHANGATPPKRGRWEFKSRPPDQIEQFGFCRAAILARCPRKYS